MPVPSDTVIKAIPQLTNTMVRICILSILLKFSKQGNNTHPLNIYVHVHVLCICFQGHIKIYTEFLIAGV